jgi:hypothetical protein
MAKAQSPQRKPANLSVEQIKSGIKRIDQRIVELESFDLKAIEHDFESNVEALRKKVNSTLQDILGYDSIEYDDYDFHPFGLALINKGTEAARSHCQKVLNRAIIQLKSLKEVLEERVAHAVPSQNQSAAQPSPILVKSLSCTVTSAA